MKATPPSPKLYSFSPIHLPPIMALYTPYSLSDAVSTPVLVVRMTVFVFVKDDTRHIPWNISAMQVPIMPHVLALDGHIVIIHRYNIEISWIYRF